MMIEVMIGLGVIYLVMLGMLVFLGYKLKIYSNYIVIQDDRMTEVLDLNEKLIAKIKLTKHLIADSSISKSEKTRIITELQ